MLIFLDTEFTDFFEPKLISLGMASEYQEDFYVEVPYPDKACSTFVRESVIPLLGRIPDSHCELDDLRLKIIKWLEIIRRNNEDVFICVDYQTDLDLFCEALDYRVPDWCKLQHVGSDINELMLYDFHKRYCLPEHHALYDAQANRYAYRPRPAPPSEGDNAVTRILKMF